MRPAVKFAFSLAEFLKGKYNKLRNNNHQEATMEIYRDSVTGLFARPTLLTCEAGSEFVLQSHSTMELEKGSRVLLKTGSRFEIAEKALLKIGKDCVFEVEPGAQLIVHQNGKIKNISNGKLLLHKGVKILK